MKAKLFLSGLLILSFISIAPVCSLPRIQQKEAVTDRKKQVIAFVNVNIVPMDKEQVLSGRTVIVKQGRITEIGRAADTKIPKDALRIDGRDKYLMPGLIDMHTHIFPDNQELFLYIANGVTTVRNMAGKPDLLKLRQQLANGELVGPNFYTCGSYLLGFKDADAVKRIVDEQSQTGYDCIKIYNILDWTKEAYAAAIETAIKNKVPAVGHLPRNLPIEVTLVRGRQTVEHVEEFLYPFFFKLDKKLDESKVPYVAKLLKDADIAVTPTIFVYEAISLMAEDNRFRELSNGPELQYIVRSVRDKWVSEENPYRKRFHSGDVPSLKKNTAFLKKLTKGLHDAGVKILLGTDASPDQPFVLPGFAIHEELRELVEAGLTPFEALQAGTSNASQILNASQEFGTIAVGKRADLILLEGNPLETVANLTRRAGVMAQGEWLSESEIQKRLGELAAFYTKNR